MPIRRLLQQPTESCESSALVSACYWVGSLPPPNHRFVLLIQLPEPDLLTLVPRLLPTSNSSSSTSSATIIAFTLPNHPINLMSTPTV